MKQFFLCYILFVISDAAKILVYIPTPSISHQVVFRPLYIELANRGHEVVVVTTDPVFPKGKAPKNLREIDVHDLSYKEWRENILTKETTTGDSSDLNTQLLTVFRLVTSVFEKQILTKEVQEVLKSDYDLLILETFVKPTLALTHVLKAPTIMLSSLGTIRDELSAVGAPTFPKLHYPYCLHQRVYNLTLWEKIQTLYSVYSLEKHYANFEIEENAKLKQLFGDDMPTLHELNENIDLLFVNIYPIWELNRPVPPNVVYIGGIHNKPSKELPENIKSYLDSSKNGVIYVSFGTNVRPSALPKEKIQIFVKVFSKLPYDVLWKFDTELEGKRPNIRTETWLPQSDLLKHPKIKLFITQGGLQSTDEALLAGVPLIGIPMFGDQWFNTEHYAHHKIGLKVDMDTLSEEKLFNAINSVVNDDSYRENVKRLSSLIHDQPQSALDRAVWWTEHVIRHRGAKHLRASTANITWAEYLDVELMSAVLLVVLLLLVMIVMAIVKIVRLLRYFFRVKNKVD